MPLDEVHVDRHPTGITRNDASRKPRSRRVREKPRAVQNHEPFGPPRKSYSEVGGSVAKAGPRGENPGVDADGPSNRPNNRIPRSMELAVGRDGETAGGPGREADEG